MNESKQTLAGWGNYPRAECILRRPERYHQLKEFNSPTIARGLGRSYGDASLNTNQAVILMERLNRFLSFDETTGVLQAEAGVSLAEILEVFVPRGWFLPVTPGTKYATLGGCIACDVHGKNHHGDGTFSKFVHKIELLLADGSTKRCSPTQESELFWATVGGMGLTGIITQAALQLIPIHTAHMRVRHYAAQDLDGILHILEDTSREERYSVAWIDCLAKGKALGRGIVIQGHHAEVGEIPNTNDPLQLKKRRPSTVGSKIPSFLLNRWTMHLFNTSYYAANRRKKEPFNVHYESFFYPLDIISDWNQLYGKKGFIQYQCVIPTRHSREAFKKILSLCSKMHRESFLAVLKRFGPQGSGHLSFPFEGYTLSLDIPVANSGLFPFLDKLDEIVLAYGGRLYLAKDARLSSETLRVMYPRVEEWKAIKGTVDPLRRFSSDLSRRLKLEGSA